MGQSSYVHLDDCHIKAVRDKAILVEYEGEEHWLSRSQVAGNGDNLEKGDGPVTVSITAWVAEQKGFEVE